MEAYCLKHKENHPFVPTSKKELKNGTYILHGESKDGKCGMSKIVSAAVADKLKI
jgi:hypothetical protein